MAEDDRQRRGSTLARVAGLLLMLAALAGWGGPARAGDTIRIGTEGAYPPFNYLEGNELQGFEIDIARSLCERMKATCVFSVVDWDSLIPDLVEGRIDAIVASMEINDERRERIDFTRSYYHTPAAFMTRTDSDLASVTPQALEGRTVGVRAGSPHAAYLAHHYPGTTVRAYGSLDDASLDLSLSRIDAVLGDKIALAEWLKRGKEASCCKFLADAPWDASTLGEGYGIGVRQGDTALARRFEAALDSIEGDGTYDRIRQRYFAFDVRQPR
jgi:polar amino acid transport system substrate-binding protein